MGTRININGEINEEGFVSAFDHGFLFGDSIYEVISTYNNKPCFLDEHLKRLRASAAGIDLKIPYSQDRFIVEVSKTILAAGNSESYIRIVVTRGIGEIDIDPSTCDRPNVVIYVTEGKNYPAEDYSHGINLAIVTVKRNPREALNPGIKTGNYLNNVLAKMEASKLGAKDALMLNPFGYLTESTTSNFFFIREGRILTPSLDCGILAGITRELVIQLARENGVPVVEGEWSTDDLEMADEMFITGTLKKLMPVSHLDGRAIGNGKPGPVTCRLMKLYDSFIENMV